MAKLVAKYGHQKKNMCHHEIGLCDQLYRQFFRFNR